LTAYEFWRGRDEPLVSRWPAIFILFAQGALFLLRTPLVALLPGSVNDSVFNSVWVTVLSFESLLLAISSAFILVALAKERAEFRHRTALATRSATACWQYSLAPRDPLTGVANRRAFLQDASLLAKRHSDNPRPTAVLAIDLDRFKLINDRFLATGLSEHGGELLPTEPTDQIRPTHRLSRRSALGWFIARSRCLIFPIC
jgi:diguanylate cyclase with GGDEF domain